MSLRNARENDPCVKIASGKGGCMNRRYTLMDYDKIAIIKDVVENGKSKPPAADEKRQPRPYAHSVRHSYEKPIKYP